MRNPSAASSTAVQGGCSLVADGCNLGCTQSTPTVPVRDTRPCLEVAEEGRLDELINERFHCV